MKVKTKKTEIMNRGNKTIKEFKEFISRGNVLDMAVGVIIGSAFGKIVTSIVNDILMPLIGIVIGGLDFSGLSLQVGSANIMYGMFIQNVIDFLIVALCIFVIVKVVSKLSKRNEEVKEELPKKSDEVLLLEEIRDLLKKQNKKDANK